MRNDVPPLSDFTAPAGATPIAAVTVTHPADKRIGAAVIDLGGGRPAAAAATAS